MCNEIRIEQALNTAAITNITYLNDVMVVVYEGRSGNRVAVIDYDYRVHNDIAGAMS